jgi:hypothetical protein
MDRTCLKDHISWDELMRELRNKKKRVRSQVLASPNKRGNLIGPKKKIISWKRKKYYKRLSMMG